MEATKCARQLRRSASRAWHGTFGMSIDLWLVTSVPHVTTRFGVACCYLPPQHPPSAFAPIKKPSASGMVPYRSGPVLHRSIEYARGLPLGPMTGKCRYAGHSEVSYLHRCFRGNLSTCDG